MAGVVADFETFYQGEFPKVYRACLAFSQSAEESVDATQEAFAKAFARWKRLSRETWAGGWVMTTAINECKKRNRAGPSPIPAPTQSDPARLDLVEALRLLPLKQRTAAVLFYIGDRSLTDVAGAMGISEGAVKAHLSRARQALRTTLGADHAAR